MVPASAYPIVRAGLTPRLTALACGAILCAALSGCGSGPAIDNPQPVSADAYRATFDAGVLVLRDHGFTVNRQDYRFGRITSKPKPSPNVTQFWTADNGTFDQAMSSSLNNQRRIVTISLTPTKGEGDGQANETGAYLLQVEVELQRLSDTTRRMTGSMEAYSVSRNLTDRPDEFRRANVPTRKFYLLEKDTPMEQRMLADILQRAAELKPVKVETQD
ncbi:MAG: hypothetical protein WD768_02230 [Phycisphaeraceae bacterium]